MRLEELRRAYKIARDLSIDYGEKTPEEIKELDDALDIVFTLAKEKIIEAEAEIDKRARLKDQNKNKCRDCVNFSYDCGGLDLSRGNCYIRDAPFTFYRKPSNKACKKFERDESEEA